MKRKSFMQIVCVNQNMLEILELLWTFHAWYKRGYPFSLKNGKEKFEMQEAIRIMMRQIKKFAPRKMVGIYKNFMIYCTLSEILKIMEVPTTLMQLQMKITKLILQKDQAEELIKREVFVSQVSKRLCETDLIRKANRSLMRYISGKDIDVVCSGAELNEETGIVNHDEDGNIDDDVQVILFHLFSSEGLIYSESQTKTK